MLKAQPTTLTLAGELLGETGMPEERLSMTQATALAVVLSVSLWAAIGLGVRWLVV